MADDPGPTRDDARTHQAFTLYGANGRVYASNVDQKLIDLGALVQDGNGWTWVLDGSKLSRSGLASAADAMRDMVKQMSFLYLDGQFTALADVRQDAGVHLEGAEQLDIVVDELQPDERMEDARA